MDCNKCGSKNQNDARICENCGAALHGDHDIEITIALSPIEVEQETRAIEETSAEEPLLIVKKGPFVGQRFNLDKSVITLGRDPGSDIFLDDVTVSRNHAKIRMDADQVTISDIGSLNGTFVNQERIEEEINLHSNDELQIGKFQLVFLARK